MNHHAAQRAPVSFGKNSGLVAPVIISHKQRGKNSVLLKPFLITGKKGSEATLNEAIAN
jgi:hypothetical protein